MLTSGTLSALQEVLASWIAKDVTKNGHYISSRVPKMAVYGAFISAPLGHFLIHILQKLFSGRTSLKAKILQILVSNLVVSLLFSTQNMSLGPETNFLFLRSRQSRILFTLPPWLSSPAPGPSTRSGLLFERVLCPL